MQRRDFVKAIMAATVTARAALGQEAGTAAPPPKLPTPPPPASVAPAPVPWMRGLMETKQLTIAPLAADSLAELSTKFFTATQMATLRHLGDILMPAHDGYPGATEAGVAEFLDFLIGISPEDRQTMYRSGLDRLDSESRKRWSVGFAATSAEQADVLLKPWFRTWMTDHPPTEPYAKFVNLAHLDIRTATTNSQAWSDAAHAAGKSTPGVDLYWYPVDPDVHHESVMRGRRTA